MFLYILGIYHGAHALELIKAFIGNSPLIANGTCEPLLHQFGLSVLVRVSRTL